MAGRRREQQSASAHALWQSGPLLIGGGVLLILAAQFFTNLPAVSAIALIGRGVILTLRSRPRTVRQDSLVLVNLAVYGVLVCLAIVAQSNAVLTSGSSVSLGMLLDHSVAIVLLLGLIFRVFYRLSQPTS